MSASSPRNARHCAGGDRLRAIGTGTTRKPWARTPASSGPSAHTPTTSCPSAWIASISGTKKCASEKSTFVTSMTFIE